MTCRFDGCGRPNFGRGWCVGHYEQVVRHGIKPKALRGRRGVKGKVCAFPECGRAALTKDLCGTHYSQQSRGRILTPIIPRGWTPSFAEPGTDEACTFPECDRPRKLMREGLCTTHAKHLRAGVALRPLRARVRPMCAFDGCAQHANTRGLCSAHDRQRGRGQELRPIVKPTGRNPYRTVEGYVMVWAPDHPNSQKSGYIFEHKLVVSERFGRPLLPHEDVHHRNGHRDDNRIENLELWTRSHPRGQRVTDKLAWARDLLAQYEGVERLIP